MKKVLLALTLVIFVCSAVAAEETESKNTVNENILKDIVGFITRPAEAIIGQAVKLQKIVISPGKIRESSLMTASSITAIDSEEIASSQKRFVKDILPDYAGISETQAGAFGGTATIRMRGANPNQTLLMIDNMRVYDPASPDGAFNFANLSFDNVSQIEITRGPQGALYGSDAIGGVINIESRKPYKPYLETGIEAGSFRTLDEYVNFGGYTKGLHYSFAYSQFNTRGIPMADPKTVPNIHAVNPYVRKSVAGRLDYEINSNLTVGATLRNVYSRFRYDDSDPITYLLRDNDQLIGKNNLFLYSVYVEHQPIDCYDYSVKYSYMNNLRRDADYISGLSDWYEGRAARLDFQNNFHIKDFDIFTIGYDYIQELSDSFYVDNASGVSDSPKVFSRDSGLYLQNKLFFKDIIGSTQSMRVDNHSQFGTHNTYKIDGFYLAPTGTRLRAVYSTGFRAPSLYQLNAPANAAWWFLGGNPSLKPEEAKSYELGVEQFLFNKMLRLSVTYFQIRFSNLIKYYTDPATYQSTYLNVSKAKSEGMEYEGEVALFKEKLKITANITATETKDYSTDRDIARVPQNQFNVGIKFTPISKLALGANIKHVGRYFDVGTDKIKEYTVVRLTGDYAISEHFNIYGRMENVFNKHYQTIRGYGEPGLAAYGGINAKF